MRDFNKDFAKACKMCLKAKKTNEAKDAWKLVDFMYDQLLTENVKNDIKDSLTDFMDMLKTDLKILKNKVIFHFQYLKIIIETKHKLKL